MMGNNLIAAIVVCAFFAAASFTLIWICERLADLLHPYDREETSNP